MDSEMEREEETLEWTGRAMCGKGNRGKGGDDNGSGRKGKEGRRL